ncbi:MAG: 2-isopropylmalate synthase, partial [Myxococcota bacterium]
MSQDIVRIFDTTLRDGEQSPGCSMNLSEKVTLARQLEKLGVDVIEAGFPVASQGDFEAVQAVARELTETTVCGLARTGREDIERAGEALEHARHPRIHTFIATSDIHLEHKLRMDRAQVLEEVDRSVRQARGMVDDVEFSAEDATRSDPEYLVEVFQTALAAGASTLNVPDTVGYTQPEEYAALIDMLRQRVHGAEKAVFAVHCHDDLGLAVANSLAAVRAGARQVECTVNGIGERAGNTSMEEVVMALKTRRDVYGGLDTKIDTTEIYASSRMLSSIIGISVQPNKAIVGDNAFAHEAGIHQDGVLKAPITYEILTPQSIGRPSNELVLGKHSGRHAFRDRLEELGFALDGDDFQLAFRRVKDLADKKKTIFNEDLEAIVADSV